MAYIVTVSFARDREYEFKFQDTAVLPVRDAAQQWLDREWSDLDCVPSNPLGKVLTLDKVLSVARFAGDMAVTFVATGGVTLAGGVLPRIVDFLDDSAFRAAFEAKAPVDALARSIPTRLITRSDAVLAGMAAIAAAPDRYGIDYAARGWV